MANVNLISGRRAERVRLTRLARGLSLTCFVAAGLGLVTVGFMGSQIFLAKSSVAALEKELSKLRPIREQIEADEKERKGLQPKIVTLTQAQGATKKWFGIMDGLRRAVPEETWLTNVSVEQNGVTGQTMKINGVSVSQTRVGETMYRLSGQPQFYQRVDLRFTTVTKNNGHENVEFELAAPLSQAELAATTNAGARNATQTN
jgi:Tfp pilus assembly protein PilN